MRWTMTAMAVAIPFIPIGEVFTTEFDPENGSWTTSYLYKDEVTFTAYLLFSVFILYYIWMNPKSKIIRTLAIAFSCIMLFYSLLYFFPIQDFLPGQGVGVLFMFFAMFLVYIFINRIHQGKTTDFINNQ